MEKIGLFFVRALGWVIGFTLVYGITHAKADCIYGAKTKTNFSMIDSHTAILKGGVGPDLLIKTMDFIYSGSSILVLKDSFCDYDDSAIYIDGNTINLTQVRRL